MAFQVGDKVKCIDEYDRAYSGLKYGSIYTITKVLRRHVRLQEIDGYWWHVRFVFAKDLSNPHKETPMHSETTSADAARMKRQLDLAESYNFEREGLTDRQVILDLYNYVLLALGKPKAERIPGSYFAPRPLPSAYYQPRVYPPYDTPPKKAENGCPDKAEPSSSCCGGPCRVKKSEPCAEGCSHPHHKD